MHPGFLSFSCKICEPSAIEFFLNWSRSTVGDRLKDDRRGDEIAAGGGERANVWVFAAIRLMRLEEGGRSMRSSTLFSFLVSFFFFLFLFFSILNL